MLNHSHRTSTTHPASLMATITLPAIYAHHRHIFRSNLRLLPLNLLGSLWQIQLCHVQCSTSVRFRSFLLHLLELHFLSHRQILLWNRNRYLPSTFSFIHHLNITVIHQSYFTIKITNLLVRRLLCNLCTWMAFPQRQHVENPSFHTLSSGSLCSLLTQKARKRKSALSLGNNPKTIILPTSKLHVPTEQSTPARLTRLLPTFQIILITALKTTPKVHQQ